MNFYNKLPTLVKVPLHHRIVGSELKKWLPVSQKFGAELCTKPTVYSDVSSRKILSSVKNLQVSTNEHKVERKEFNEFIIEEFKGEDMVEVKKILSKNYSSFNPLRSLLHMSYEDQMEFLDQQVHQRLGNNVSIVARDRITNKIVGAILPWVHSRQDKISRNLASSNYYSNNIKVNNLNQILEIVRTSVNLFDKYNVDKILEPSMAVVDANSSGKGLLNRLYQEVTKRGIEQEIQIVMSVPTHAVTQAISKACNGVLEFELDFGSVKIDGKQVLDLKEKSDISSFQVYSFYLHNLALYFASKYA